MAAAAQANSERAAEAVEAVSDAPSDAIVDVQSDAPEEDAPESVA
jgi:CMP-2-keto-3-deoxyoctulosonic acid synthetase